MVGMEARTWKLETEHTLEMNKQQDYGLQSTEGGGEVRECQQCDCTSSGLQTQPQSQQRNMPKMQSTYYTHLTSLK